jgi:hypothetical protein
MTTLLLLLLLRSSPPLLRGTILCTPPESTPLPAKQRLLLLTRSIETCWAISVRLTLAAAVKQAKPMLAWMQRPRVGALQQPSQFNLHIGQ